MKSIDYTNVKEIVVLNSETEVNKKLKKHWKLIAIETESDGSVSQIKYILGWIYDENETEFNNVDLGF